MSPRSTLVLLVVVAAAFAALWLFEIRGAEERAEAEEAAKRVFRDLQPEELAWIELRTAGEGTPEGERQTARLERGEEGWRLVEPIAFPADPGAADGIASALTDLVSERVFEEHEGLEAYGLAGEPRVRFGTGDARYALRIGDKTPVGGNTYVAAEQGEPVYAVETFRTNAFQKTLQELRDARVLDFDRSSVTGVEVRWPGASVRLTREEEGWRLVEPLETEADGGTVEDLLSDLYFLRADDFVDAPGASAEELGLEEPAFRVELARGEGAEPVVLGVGSTADGATRAVRGRDGHVYRIDAARLDGLPRSVDAYRFKTLADFDPAAAARFELVFQPGDGGEALRVEGTRGDGGWESTPSMGSDQAGALLTELSGLEAEAVAADAMGEDELAALGLAPARARLRVFGRAQDEGGEAPVLADVSLGARRSERGIAARRADREEVYWLDEGAAEHLPVSLEAWRNRFEAAEVEDAPEAPAEAGGAPAEGARPAPPAGEAGPAASPDEGG